MTKLVFMATCICHGFRLKKIFSILSTQSSTFLVCVRKKIMKHQIGCLVPFQNYISDLYKIFTRAEGVRIRGTPISLVCEYQILIFQDQTEKSLLSITGTLSIIGSLRYWWSGYISVNCLLPIWAQLQNCSYSRI